MTWLLALLSDSDMFTTIERNTAHDLLKTNTYITQEGLKAQWMRTHTHTHKQAHTHRNLK